MIGPMTPPPQRREINNTAASPATAEEKSQQNNGSATSNPEVTASNDATNAEELANQVMEMEDKWRRAVADLDNFRKRMVRDIDHRLNTEKQKQAALWLPVLDNLDLALQHADADRDTVLQGVQAIRNQAIDVLTALGFPRQDKETGAPFDPARHEAVAAVPSKEVADGTIIEVVRPGYGDGDQQLRPTAVVVAAKAE